MLLQYLAAASSVSRFTYFATKGKQGSFTLPAGCRAEDLVVFLDHAESVTSSTPTNVTPDGFTQIATETGSNGSWRKRTTLSYCSLPADFPFTDPLTNVLLGAFGTWRLCMVYRPSKLGLAITVGSVHSQATNSDPSPQTITKPSGQNFPYLAVGAYFSSLDMGGISMSPTATYSEEFDASFTYINLRAWYTNSVPQDVTVDIGVNNFATTLMSCYLKAA